MMADFDIAAHTYDKDFTHSEIGILQRQRVWRLLEKILVNSNGLKVLELNCGTGEDAVRFAKKGNNVIATDVSEEMLKIARAKSGTLAIEFMKLDLNEVEQFQFDEKFDLIFSNFGGLNCIDAKAMARLGSSLSSVLEPGGRFIAVVMPKICLWESLYLFLKGKISDVFRRNRGFAEVNVSGKQVKTWYYNSRSFSDLLGKGFKKEKVKPIGLFIPPSYMEAFFKRRIGLLHLFNRLEHVFANFSWQARFSDHYYIELTKG